MKHEEGKFHGDGGMELYFQSWLPEETAKATLVLVHGLCEHSGRYPNVVNKLVPAGYATYTFDLRGHGRSAEKLVAHVSSWAEYHGDLRAFLDVVRQRTGNRPLFLMGHSMGALIVVEYALDHPQGLKGVIASGLPVGAVDAPRLKVLIGRLLSGIFPRFTVDTGLNVDAISRDPEAVKAYAEDPLVFSKVSARFSTEFMSAIDRTRARASQFQLPLLIIHGQADSLVPQEGSRSFFDEVPYEDKERIVFEGGYHEPHNDIHFEQVTADLLRWLDDHL